MNSTPARYTCAAAGACSRTLLERRDPELLEKRQRTASRVAIATHDERTPDVRDNAAAATNTRGTGRARVALNAHASAGSEPRPKRERQARKADYIWRTQQGTVANKREQATLGGRGNGVESYPGTAGPVSVIAQKG